jgi:hypothetical protein
MKFKLLAYVPYFESKKVGLKINLLSVCGCMSVCLSPLATSGHLVVQAL